MWYALRVRSPNNLPLPERAVTRILRSRGIRAVFAGRREQHKRGGVNSTRNMHAVYAEIPSYVFADLTEAQFLDCHKTLEGIDQVQRVIGWQEVYGDKRRAALARRAALNAEWIEGYIHKTRFPEGRTRREASEEVLFLNKNAKRKLVNFIMGQILEVTEGPFRSFKGEATEIWDEKTRIEVGGQFDLVVDNGYLREAS